MTSTIPAPLAAALAVTPRKPAFCVMLEAKDGLRAGFTTWSRALPLDLGMGEGEESYAPRINLSAITRAAGFVTSNFEIDGPAGGEFSAAKVHGGRWRQAKVWLVRVSPGVAGYQPIMRGRVAEGRVEGRRFVLEVRNAMDAFNQTQGGVLTPYCRTWFGSPKCTIVRTAYPATVTAVASALIFSLDLAGAHADDFFNYGNVAFLTGELGGTDEAKIHDYVDSTGTVELFEPLFQAPEVGDTVNVYRGCSRLRLSSDPTVPTCLSYDNGVNFRGHPEVPGQRFYHRINEPGEGYE